MEGGWPSHDPLGEGDHPADGSSGHALAIADYRCAWPRSPPDLRRASANEA